MIFAMKIQKAESLSKDVGTWFSGISSPVSWGLTATQLDPKEGVPAKKLLWALRHKERQC